jgi:RHS repeat-associated protein
MNLTVRRFASDYFVDYLGNLRVSCRCGEPKRDAQGLIIPEGQPGAGIVPLAVVQEQHYDAWGLAFSTISSSTPIQNVSSGAGATAGLETLKDKFTYNGKEQINDLDIGWNDYGFRMYDASVGRWSAVDPLAEEYQLFSIYDYCLNNPTNLVDTDGRKVMNDYKLLANGQIELIAETEDNFDRLFRTNTSGQVTENSSSIAILKNNASESTIISQLSNTNNTVFNSMSIIWPNKTRGVFLGSFFSEGFTKDITAAYSLFNFLNDNTKSGIEFSFAKYSVKGSDYYQIGTKHERGASQFESIIFSSKDLIWQIHNHDGEVGLNPVTIANQWTEDHFT